MKAFGTSSRWRLGCVLRPGRDTGRRRRLTSFHIVCANGMKVPLLIDSGARLSFVLYCAQVSVTSDLVNALSERVSLVELLPPASFAQIRNHLPLDQMPRARSPGILAHKGRELNRMSIALFDGNMDYPKRNSILELELEGGRHGLLSRQFLLPRRTAMTG